MMSIQFKIWKRVITEQTPFSSRHVSKAMSLLPSPAIYVKPYLEFLTFCTETTLPSTIPPDRGVVEGFFLNKCRLTEEDITKAFKNRNHLLQYKSAKDCEEFLELLNGCGLSTPAQIRKVALYRPTLFFHGSERNIKSKLSFLRAFMKGEDIAKLICSGGKLITLREDMMKSSVSLLQKLGLHGEALSEFLGRAPEFLSASEKDVMESFKNAEDLGLKNGSKTFSYVMRLILRLGKEKLDRKRLCLSTFGFSEKQISDFLRGHPNILCLSKEKVKRNVDYLVNSVGLALDDLVNNPFLFEVSLEKKLIPRYRVIKALESMQVLKTKVSIPTLCLWSERIFLEKYIHSNAELSSLLLDIYHGGKVGPCLMQSCPCCCWISTIVGKLVINKEKR